MTPVVKENIPLLLNHLDTKECTDLDRYNIKMLMGLDYLQKFIETEIKTPLIKVVQWLNGSHWYATVDGVDVVDASGQVKWDSYEEAYNKAKIQARNPEES